MELPLAALIWLREKQIFFAYIFYLFLPGYLPTPPFYKIEGVPNMWSVEQTDGHVLNQFEFEATKIQYLGAAIVPTEDLILTAN